MDLDAFIFSVHKSKLESLLTLQNATHIRISIPPVSGFDDLVVFAVFTPPLMFANLAKSVTLEDIISWWFMPVNIAITFLVGVILGWIVVKILKPESHLEGLIMATCSTGWVSHRLSLSISAMEAKGYTQDGSVDLCGRRDLASRTGRWRAYSFLVGYEAFERMPFYGVASNLVVYRTTQLHEDTVSSVRNVNNWSGSVWITPILGAYIADSYLGWFWTFTVSSLIYVLSEKRREASENDEEVSVKETITTTQVETKGEEEEQTKVQVHPTHDVKMAETVEPKEISAPTHEEILVPPIPISEALVAKEDN